MQLLEVWRCHPAGEWEVMEGEGGRGESTLSRLEHFRPTVWFGTPIKLV